MPGAGPIFKARASCPALPCLLSVEDCTLLCSWYKKLLSIQICILLCLLV